jgi:molybdopterin biosynthesis enzyme MoaB
VVLKGVVVVPRWSATSSSIVGVVIEPLVLELPGQTNAILHLVFSVLVKRAHAIKDLLVLFIVVTLGTRLANSGNDVF